MSCSLCNLPFSETKDSEEHIIPQSIGGKKVVTGYICETCNNTKGNEWDSKLAKQLNPLSILFKIKRERSEVPSITLSTDKGTQFVISVSGQISLTKPTYKEQEIPEENKTLIHIQARNEKEARQQILRAKKYHPQLDVDSLMKQVKMTSSYTDDYFVFNMGVFDENCVKSIVKTALSLVVKSGISSDYCKYAKDYLQNISSDYCFGYFYEIDPILNRPEGTPLHCVFVKGDPNNGIIYAYIELFGVHRGLVCLSDTYEGDSFEDCYAIDPRTSKQLDLDISLDISKEDLKKYILTNSQPLEKVKEILNEIIPLQLQLDSDNEQERVLTHAVNTAFANCGAAEGEALTDEHREKILARLLTEMEPWIFNQVRARRNKP